MRIIDTHIEVVVHKLQEDFDKWRLWMADVQDPDTRSTWFSWNKARTSAYTHTTDVHVAGDCKLTRKTVAQAAVAEAMPRTCGAQVLGMRRRLAASNLKAVSSCTQ
jgi:hypothetical protein